MMASKVKSPSFLEFVYEFYKTMKDNDISLVYEGEITHQITKAFTSLAESNMEQEAESSGIQKKVFHVMVECLQNISKHGARPDPSREGRGIFLVSKGEDEYNVTSGNIIENEHIDKLKENLEHINSLDKAELKALYKKQIREGRLSDKGGAGLGFIDIARKTGEKLYYNFLPLDDKVSFFMLIITVNRKK